MSACRLHAALARDLGAERSIGLPDSATPDGRRALDLPEPAPQMA
jgi:hypothetical protein